MLTEKLRFKLGEPVHGRIVEPVFAFDREVIPRGAEVLGKVVGFRSRGTWKRVSSLLAGDFTPIRDPQIVFDTLVLEDATRIPIETAVEPGTDTLIRFAKDVKPDLENDPQMRTLMAASKQSGGDLLKGMLWGLAPYRPQFAPSGMRFKATLLERLDFGAAVLGLGALDKVGSDPPAGRSLYVSLETPLDSRTAKAGTTVKALLTQPLFSRDGLLIYPVGSRLVGEVVSVRRAAALHHNGELSFKFTRIEPLLSIYLGVRPAQKIEGSLAGALVGNAMNQLRIDQEGAARITNSNGRFLAPALALFNLSQGFNSSADSWSQAIEGAYGGSVLKRVLGADPGFGLPAGVAGRMVPPVGIALGLYSAGRSVFLNILGRGQEIQFPVGAPLEIRLD